MNARDDAGWLATIENVNFGWYLLVLHPAVLLCVVLCIVSVCRNNIMNFVFSVRGCFVRARAFSAGVCGFVPRE